MSLVTPDGRVIDPAKLAEECYRAGQIDAEAGRFQIDSFTTAAARVAYQQGHDVQTARQTKREVLEVTRFDLPPRRERRVDEWAQRVREMLRRVRV